MDTDQLIAQLSSEAPSKKPMESPVRQAAKWLLGLLCYSALLFVLIEPRPDLAQKLRSLPFLIELLLLLGIMASSTLSAATLAFPDRYQQPTQARLPGIFFTLFMLFMLAQCLTAPAISTLTVAECMCTLFITIYGFLPTVWLFFMMRDATSTQPAFAGSVVVLSAFSLEALLLRISEPNDGLMHMMLYHYLPMLVAAYIGVLLGRKLLRW